jgi:hypothetical protein
MIHKRAPLQGTRLRGDDVVRGPLGSAAAVLPQGHRRRCRSPPPRATTVATGPVVRCRRSSSSGTSPLARSRKAPPSVALLKVPPLACPRKPSPPSLKPNPWRSGVFYSCPNLVRLNRMTPLSQSFL